MVTKAEADEWPLAISPVRDDHQVWHFFGNNRAINFMKKCQKWPKLQKFFTIVVVPNLLIQFVLILVWTSRSPEIDSESGL